MELVRGWVDYQSPAGPVAAFLARPAPAKAPVPAVVVIQEVWGVDGHIVDVAERMASAGYVALAPDLYSAGRGRPPVLAPERVEAAKAFLNSVPPEQWMAVLGDEARRAEALGALPAEEGARVGETIGALFGGVGGDPPRHMEVLQAALGYLHAHPACAGRRIGSLGFCMGGGLSAQLACAQPACAQPDLAGAVVFYGASPAPEEVARVRCPVRGFYGEDDPRIVEGLRAFDDALEKAGCDRDLRVYPETPHAFFNDTRPSYRPEAARDAWGRMLSFFAEALGQVPTVALANSART